MTDKSQQPDACNFVSEGLIEFLQIAAPSWATKLTRERLSFVRLIAEANRENQRLKALLEEKNPKPHGGPDFRTLDVTEACRRLAVRRMTAWTSEDDKRSQDFRDGIEKAASDIACAIARLADQG